MSQPPKFSLYKAGLQEKIFAVNEDQPSPPRPMSARSRVSVKSAPSKRPGSAHNHRSRGSNLKASEHRSSGHPLQPVPPGQARKKHPDTKDHPDMRSFMVLGRDELLSQLTAMKKKQGLSDTIINQLRAENQRWTAFNNTSHHFITSITICLHSFAIFYITSLFSIPQFFSKLCVLSLYL
jgi:hypothetical protein